ncbi:mandelate racemase/muconate lactonizing enzyme family protein [Brevibacillus sp. SYSU BS000544]|uniref:mandelate racemase/muconate lactonizing enzyme family protein n=1 Tax=Brevibacillus sp. SYSU BS000544 TaxID=3416443 RepID=UPI003CE56732
MYIDRVETFPCLYKVTKPYGDANGFKKYRVIYLIKITTRSGYIGWGECIDWLPTLHKGFQERIIPYLLNKKATDHHKLVRVISKWHQRGATGVSMALTEIVAKKANLSICDLWGGAFHQTIPLYASFQSYADEENWQMNHSLSHVGKTLQEGYQMIKIKIGGRSIQEDQEHVELIQELVGSTAKIAVDANQSYDLATSRIWCDFLSKWNNILWFEEPMPVDRTGDYQQLRSFSTIPIAGGENLLSSSKFLPLLREGAVDIITPDTMHEDGIDGFRDTMQLGRNFGIRTSPHAFDGALSRIYAMLALACSPPWSKMSSDDIEPLEWDVMDNPFTSIASIRPEKGDVKVPTGIGLGLELDQERIDHYLWDGSTYI